jgi:DNA invertase Pin-like site-specific DNA recombinase
MSEHPGEQPVFDVYARISRAANGQLIKTNYQVEVCTEELAERGARVGEVFVDPSLSAWKRDVVRPDWEKLMARLESGAADGVMFYDVTRFSRKILEGERLVEAAERGIRVWSLTGEYNLATADGRRHFREAMVAAAGESDKNSERIKHGKIRRARKGRTAGGARSYGMPGWAPAPEDWEPGDPREMVPDEQVAAERAVIAECYERLLGGEPLPAVVRDLNGRGITTVNGMRWRRNSLRLSLTRPVLAGLVTLNGTVVSRLAGTDPVVDVEDWERLCAILDGRPLGRPQGQVHRLTGLMACGQCGHTLHGMPRRQLPPYPDGSVRREYRCRKDASHFGCGHNVIDAAAAEAIVAEAVKARLGDPRRADRIAARLAQVREQRAGKLAEISALEESADNLAVKTATWGVDRVDKAMKPILTRLEELRRELAALDEPEDVGMAAEEAAAEWDKAEAVGDTAAMRAMIRRAFPNLVLYPAAQRGDRSPQRFAWDGPRPPAALRSARYACCLYSSAVRLLSLDYSPVYKPALLAGFGDDDSVFDYDVVIWDPQGSFGEYTFYTSQLFQGLLSLSESTSVQIKADAIRRRAEFVEYINEGRVLVVFVRPPQECYIDTGQRDYSGTGRNRVTTKLMAKFDLLSAVPVTDCKFIRASGTRIEFDGDGPIVALLRKYKKFLRYEAVMTQAPGTSLAHIAGTDRRIGSIQRSKGGGYLVLLPAVNLAAQDSEDEEKWVEEAPQFQVDLLAAIEQLSGSKTVSRPAWAEQYTTAEQQDLRTKVTKQQARIEVARAKLAELQRGKEAAEIKDQLFLGTGRALELEVRSVFELLGGTVSEPEPGRDDWRVSFPEGNAVLEVKGVTKSAAEKQAAQLEKWVAGVMEETGKAPKGILIVNTWRDLPLSERTEDDFPTQMLPYCKSRNHCLITGLQLFVIRADVEKDPSRAEHWRKAFLETAGQVVGCEDWRSVIQETIATTAANADNTE